MASIIFGDLLQLMLTELADTIQQSEAQASAAHVRLDDIELDIPVHLQLLQRDSASEVDSATRVDTRQRLIVGMPSPREVLPAGRVGRIKVTFAAVQNEQDAIA